MENCSGSIEKYCLNTKTSSASEGLAPLIPHQVMFPLEALRAPLIRAPALAMCVLFLKKILRIGPAVDCEQRHTTVPVLLFLLT